jgi:hypothetical protein
LDEITRTELREDGFHVLWHYIETTETWVVGGAYPFLLYKKYTVRTNEGHRWVDIEFQNINALSICKGCDSSVCSRIRKLYPNAYHVAMSWESTARLIETTGVPERTGVETVNLFSDNDRDKAIAALMVLCPNIK